jgi:uncharacterized membrane protein YqjE
MSRHPFRWPSLVFGMTFLAAVAVWAVWRQELLTTRQLSLTASAALIVLGVLGVVATLRQGRPARPASEPEGDIHEAAHPHA